MRCYTRATELSGSNGRGEIITYRCSGVYIIYACPVPAEDTALTQAHTPQIPWEYQVMRDKLLSCGWRRHSCDASSSPTFVFILRFVNDNPVARAETAQGTSDSTLEERAGMGWLVHVKAKVKSTAPPVQAERQHEETIVLVFSLFWSLWIRVLQGSFWIAKLVVLCSLIVLVPKSTILRALCFFFFD